MTALDIAPATGKLGVLTPGMGAVATTFYAGVLAAREGIAQPVGSVSQKVVSLADTDVLVVRDCPRDEDAGKQGVRTLLTVDGSNGSEAGITSFMNKLQAERTEIRLIHIIESLPTLWAVGSRPDGVLGLS